MAGEEGEEEGWNGSKMGLRTIAFRLRLLLAYICLSVWWPSSIGALSSAPVSFPLRAFGGGARWWLTAMSRWADNLTDLEGRREFKGKEGGREGSDVKNDWMSFFSVPVSMSDHLPCLSFIDCLIWQLVM